MARKNSTKKAAKKELETYPDLEASPVKSFFVSMLTRDISLEEAILDLLDNCVDGILRTDDLSQGAKPYKGYWARIKFNKEDFEISDNCGGIPVDMQEYAFRMGRPLDRPPDVTGTVGVYGIGMKRAFFKMGRNILLSTQHKKHGYEVEINSDWIEDEEKWTIPVRHAGKSMDEDGTTIVVSDLYDGISNRFGVEKELFSSGLHRLIASHYAFIIAKGFEVYINNDPVIPKPTSLMFQEGGKKSETSIRPFIFKTKVDGVNVFLTVGLTGKIPTQDELDDELESTKRSSINAGWTIVCNERAVLYADRTELTGWGEAGVPRYHNQFIAIAGIVEFSSDDPSKLPTTTTKRGIDASSTLYLQVKNKMREGMQIFTDFTNKWKSDPEESEKLIKAGTPMILSEIKSAIVSSHISFSSTKKTALKGSQFKPNLPFPKRLQSKARRISYVKDLKSIQLLGEYLFENPQATPADIGEECFDIVLKSAKK